MKSKDVRNDRLRNELNYLFKRFSKGIKATRYSGGRINSTWLVNKNGEEVIVRFYPPFFKEKLAVEIWVMSEMEKFGSLTPKLIDYDTEGYITPVLFMSKLPGFPLADQWHSINEVEFKQIIKDVNDLLYKAAALPIGSIGYLHESLNIVNVAQYTEWAIREYIEIIRRFGLLTQQESEELKNILQRLPILMLGKKARLTYPDLSSGNIMVYEGRFSGLIDWEFVMGFEPLYGFGNLLFEFSFRHDCSWATPKLILECFPVALKEEIVLLAILRTIEMLSYLPTTGIYTRSEKQTRLKDCKLALSELRNLISH